MKAQTFILAGWLAAVMLPAVPATAQDAAAPLPLDQAIVQALEKSPLLGASAARAGAAAASQSQAGVLPNPEVAIEADNIYGDGAYDGLGGAEVTYGVTQLIEMPGKRGGRMDMAAAEAQKARYILDATRLDLIRDVTVAFAEVAAAQQDVLILEDERQLAAEMRSSVAAKVEAGKEPPIQKSKAEIEHSISEIALERARRNLNARKQALLSLMSGDAGAVSVAEESLPELIEPEALESYRSRLLQTPDARQSEADIIQAEAGLAFEKANAIPDPTLSFGVKDLRGDDSRAFVAGVSFPFPVFNMNRAGVERAGHDLNAAKQDRQGAQLSRESRLMAVYGALGNAYSEAKALKATVLPGAEEAFSFAREGYKAGKFSYIEVLDAQRTLFVVRRQFSEALLDYHRQRAELERLTASSAYKNPSSHKDK